MAKDHAMAQSSLHSDKFSKLSGKERNCYLSKIALLSGIDPYTLKRSDLIGDLFYLFFFCLEIDIFCA